LFRSSVWDRGIRTVESILAEFIRRNGAIVKGGRSMTLNEKDYMDRYIYQVIRRLPKAQRDEVRMELEELISDMYADKGSMEAILTQLGNPAEFAKQYQNGQQYLIGPEYFETYLWFVKIVLICAAVPILVISLINAIGEMPAASSWNAASVIIRAIVDGLTAGITDALL